MKKLAIVSSYSDSCGNAAFTKVLRDSIELYSNNFVQVEVIELNLSLLQSIHPRIRKTAERHVTDICRQLKTYDLVNIQFEAGLYGGQQKDIISRVKRMISSNPNTSVTLHSPRLIGKFQNKATWILTAKRLITGKLISIYKDYYNPGFEPHINTNHTIISFASKKKCQLIVHTKRAKTQIKNFYGYENVDVHPLVIVPENFKTSSTELDSIKAALSIKPDEVVIGMFGYVSSYKGHSEAIDAMKYLPKKYKLLIFGRQHPQTLKDSSKDPYLVDLIEMIKQFINYESKITKRKSDINGVKLSDKVVEKDERIFFMGELSDKSFIEVASAVDIAWLPYYENGQDGSGIASICLDASPRVLCSTSFAFDELFKLKKYRNYMRMDIGNYLELASKTIMFLSLPKPEFPYGDSKEFNMKSQSQVYSRKLFSQNESAVPNPI